MQTNQNNRERKAKAKQTECGSIEVLFGLCTQISTQMFAFYCFYPYICLINQLIKLMQIITTREFRANQKKYFELAEKEIVLVSRRNKAPVAIFTPSDEDFLTKKEIESIGRGFEEIRQGKTIRIENVESIWESIL